MHIQLLKSKIHRARVTDASLDYEGSLAIAEDLMKAVDIQPFERILVGNMGNGERFETYAIPASSGSGTISLNGATAHLGKIGDLLTIMCFAWVTDAEALRWKPRVIVVSGDQNQIVKRTGS